jgi:putative transposase
MVSVPARREQVTYAVLRGVSQRRACTLMKVARSALSYRSRLGVKNAQVLARMAELSGTRTIGDGTIGDGARITPRDSE